MRTVMVLVSACGVMLGAAFAAEPAPPKFAAKPTATKAGDKVKIEFAVDRPTDVAVFVEDAKGRIVRHLVAGVLGQNPPPPLKAGALAQSVEWDGQADYGRPAGPGPFRVRVALGLSAAFDRVAKSDPLGLGSIRSLAAGPDGTLYVRMSTGGGWPNGTGEMMLALNRDGSYQRMLMPYPSNLPKDKVPGVGTLNLDGRPAPVVRRIDLRDFYGAGGQTKSGMTVTPDGQVIYPLRGMRLAAVDADGALSWGSFAGPFLFGRDLFLAGYQRIFLTMSSDGRSVYLSGLGHCTQTVSAAQLDHPYSAVFKAKLPDRAPAEVLFGDPAITGADETHLGGLPAGIATDGAGHVLVCDPANDRVVVISEKDGRFVGAMPVGAAAPPAAAAGPATTSRPRKPRPSDTAAGLDCLAVAPAGGAVYVTRLTGAGTVDLIKFSGWKEPREVARLALPRNGNPEAPWLLTLDPAANPPIIWMGADGGKLLRIEDRGNAFGEPRDVNTHSIGAGDFIDVSLDRDRQEVYFRAGPYWRFSEADGQAVPYPFQASRDGNNQLVPGPDGNAYVQGWDNRMERFDRAGKPVPWPATGTSIVKIWGTMSVNVSRSLGIRHDGRIFSFDVPPGGTLRGFRVLRQFDTQGNPVAWGPVWHGTESAVGPKFDAAGNIYMAEQIRPKDDPYPRELESSYYLYGSIVKFPPTGGMFHFPGALDPPGQKFTPAPDAKTVDAVYVNKFWEKVLPVQVTGAEWIRMGVSHIELAGCTCENTQFDVDEFGRVFYPDLCRFRVGVLDTNGNEITHFGGYGNADSQGPNGPVIDPQTKKVRPRRSDDPNDVKSPFAQPDIAFAWLIGVAATDRYAYMGDTLNRRLLRARLVYAAEEICDMK